MLKYFYNFYPNGIYDRRFILWKKRGYFLLFFPYFLCFPLLPPLLQHHQLVYGILIKTMLAIPHTMDLIMSTT